MKSRSTRPLPTFPVTRIVSSAPIPYDMAVAAMQARAYRIADGQASECVWLLEHPPCYTAGTSADPSDLLWSHRFPVYRTGRGGQYTYHGPGQRIVYTMLDVRARAGDARRLVAKLQAFLMATLATWGVQGETREGRIGIWVRRGDREDKIAALGLRVSRGISFHGVSLNVAPDLTHYGGIVACGLRDHGVTSLADLGISTSLAEVDAALGAAFATEFGVVLERLSESGSGEAAIGGGCQI